MGNAKIVIRSAFFRSVTQFFGNSQVTLMVIYGCFEIFQTMMGITKIADVLSSCVCRLRARFLQNKSCTIYKIIFYFVVS